MTVVKPNLGLVGSFLPLEDGWSSAMNDNINVLDSRLSTVYVAGSEAYPTFQAAYDAAPTGGRIYCPSALGPFVPPTAAGWTIDKPIEIFGDGPFVGENKGFQYFNSAAAANTNSRVFDLVAGARLHLHDIVISNGVGTPSALGTGDAIRYASSTLVQDLFMERVYVLYAGRNGLRLEGNNYLVRVTLKDCTFYGCKGDGVYLNLGAFVTMTGTTFSENKRAGLYAVAMGNGFLLQINAEGNGDDLTNTDYEGQVQLENCLDGMLTGCNFEDFVAATVYNGVVLNASRAITIQGCEFDGTAGNGRSIHMLNGTHNCVIGVNQHAESDESVRINSSVTDYDNVIFPQAILNGTGAVVLPAGSRNAVISPGVGTAIVAAATIAIPDRGDVFHVTGNTNITNGITVNANDNGRSITLIFEGTPTVSDTGTSKLAGNFVAAGTTNDFDTLTLRCDGTNWYEVSRSTN